MLTVPTAAIHEENGQTVVYQMKDGAQVSTPVTVGAVYGTTTQVTRASTPATRSSSRSDRRTSTGNATGGTAERGPRETASGATVPAGSAGRRPGTRPGTRSGSGTGTGRPGGQLMSTTTLDDLAASKSSDIGSDQGGEPEPILDLARVRKTYSTGTIEVEALRGIDLVVPEGEYVAIMGPSGSGKSTLMHILGCLDIPTAGTYRLAGVDVGVMDEERLAEVRNRRHRLRVPAVQPARLAHRPAQRRAPARVCAGAARRATAPSDRGARAGRPRRPPRPQAERALRRQQQRVSVARALVTDPDLILADEPTGNLDTMSTLDVLSLFAELHEQGRTVVLITHEREVAKRAARTVLIRDGHLYHSHDEWLRRGPTVT